MFSPMSAPNLPGVAPDRSSWIYRSQSGFGKSDYSRPQTANGGRSSKSMQNTASQPQFDNSFSNNRSAQFNTSVNTRPASAGATRSKPQPALSKSVNFINFDDSTNFRDSASKFEVIARPQTGLGTVHDGFLANEKVSSATGPTEPSDDIPMNILQRTPSVPSFIEREKLVARFYGHFYQARTWERSMPLGAPVIEDAVIRQLTIFYYIDDQTVEMIEKKEKNTGMSGGAFASRRRMKKTDGTPLTLLDLTPGNSVMMLGQEIFITDSDSFTKDFFRRQFNVYLPPGLPRPEASKNVLTYGAQYATGLSSSCKSRSKEGHNTKSTDYTTSKAALDKVNRFLNFDGQVLRFICIEPTPDMDIDNGVICLPGPVKKFALAYFLADGCVEVRNVRTTGSTQDMCLLVKKGKLAKNWRGVQRGSVPDYCEPVDLMCGNVLDVYGRSLLIVSCNDFTRRVYEDMELDQQEIQLVYDEVRGVDHPIPQLGDGFLPIGGQADTLRNVYGTTRPVADVKKINRNQNRLLRCKLRLVSEKVTDQKREFMLTYYLEDDTVQVFEEVIRNSGIIGGNFLKRGKYDNDLPPEGEEPRHFIPQDIYLGNVISFHGNDMRIVEMDNMSLRFCETYPEDFPMSDTFKIIERLIANMVEKKVNIRQAMSAKDPKESGVLKREVFVKALDNMGISKELNDQELLTLMRRFKDPNHDVFLYHELCDLFSHLYFGLYLHGHNSIGSGLDVITTALRRRQTQWRRLLRRDPQVVGNHLTLAQLCKIFKKHGIVLNTQEVALLGEKYGVADSNQKLLSELNKIHAEDTTLDNKISNQPNNRLSVQDLIKKRRSRMAKSVMRGGLDEASVGTNAHRGSVVSSSSNARRNTVGNTSKVVVNYAALCDDIYICDWV